MDERVLGQLFFGAGGPSVDLRGLTIEDLGDFVAYHYDPPPYDALTAAEDAVAASAALQAPPAGGTSAHNVAPTFASGSAGARRPAAGAGVTSPRHRQQHQHPRASVDEYMHAFFPDAQQRVRRPTSQPAPAPTVGTSTTQQAETPRHVVAAGGGIQGVADVAPMRRTVFLPSGRALLRTLLQTPESFSTLSKVLSRVFLTRAEASAHFGTAHSASRSVAAAATPAHGDDAAEVTRERVERLARSTAKALHSLERSIGIVAESVQHLHSASRSGTPSAPATAGPRAFLPVLPSKRVIAAPPPLIGVGGASYRAYQQQHPAHHFAHPSEVPGPGRLLAVATDAPGAHSARSGEALSRLLGGVVAATSPRKMASSRG
jgi:hypothetical protein